MTDFDDSNFSDASERFVVQMTNCQGRLFAYILSQLGNVDQAKDVLQESNLVLWRKRADFVDGTNFHAWAGRVAHFQIRAYRPKMGRDRLVFDEDIANTLAEHSDRRHCNDDDRERALHQCLGKLSDQHRDLVRQYYSDGTSAKAIAAELGKTANALVQVLHRVRLNLLRCIQQTTPER